MRKQFKFITFFIVGVFSMLIVSFNTFNIVGVKGGNLQEVPESRLTQLTQGINLGGWFSHSRLNPAAFQSAFGREDIRLIKDMGFRHVRLPVDPQVLLNEQNPKQLNEENLKYLDAAIKEILSQDLSVIVDLHPNPKLGFKQRTYNDQNFTKIVSIFWNTLAKHLSQYDPERLFLEVFNEPAVSDPQRWNAIQSELLAAMRAGAPQHTLVAAGNQKNGERWDQIGGLETVVPVKDRNVVYNFHFYQPMQFTHQGSTWAGKTLRFLRNIPYPSSPEKLIQLVRTSTEEGMVRNQLQAYGLQRWNKQKLEVMISRAARWAEKNGVHLTCNEFGVYRIVAPENSRNAWIKDVRSLLEQYNIGWNMWNYEGGFGVTVKVEGENRPDNETVTALFG